MLFNDISGTAGESDEHDFSVMICDDECDVGDMYVIYFMDIPTCEISYNIISYIYIYVNIPT